MSSWYLLSHVRDKVGTWGTLLQPVARRHMYNIDHSTRHVVRVALLHNIFICLCPMKTRHINGIWDGEHYKLYNEGKESGWQATWSTDHSPPQSWLTITTDRSSKGIRVVKLVSIFIHGFATTSIIAIFCPWADWIWLTTISSRWMTRLRLIIHFPRDDYEIHNWRVCRHNMEIMDVLASSWMEFETSYDNPSSLGRMNDYDWESTRGVGWLTAPCDLSSSILVLLDERSGIVQ